MIPDHLAWFAMGALFGLALCGWPWHPRFSRYSRRMGQPEGSYSLPPDHDWRRSINHENINRPASDRPLRFRQPPAFTEGAVQRGQGNGGPSTEKPAIVAKPQFPPPSSDGNDGRDPACVATWPDCVDGAYHPQCCRFPKSCSCGPR